eukprot:30992-Pelagococcus_subviridis.AAC.2
MPSIGTANATTPPSAGPDRRTAPSENCGIHARLDAPLAFGPEQCNTRSDNARTLPARIAHTRTRAKIRDVSSSEPSPSPRAHSPRDSASSRDGVTPYARERSR